MDVAARLAWRRGRRAALARHAHPIIPEARDSLNILEGVRMQYGMIIANNVTKSGKKL